MAPTPYAVIRPRSHRFSGLGTGEAPRRSDPEGAETDCAGWQVGSWELFDLLPGVYTLELVATDKTGAVIASRTEKVLHENSMK